jgi:hypothetical protein
VCSSDLHLGRLALGIFRKRKTSGRYSLLLLFAPL